MGSNTLNEQDVLKIYLEKDTFWAIWSICLFLLLTGGYFISAGEDIRIFGVLTFIVGAFMSVLASLVSRSYEMPLIILDNEKISYEAWPFKNLPYSEIEKVEFLLPPQVSITIANPEKYMSISRTDKLFGTENLLFITPGKNNRFAIDCEHIAKIIKTKLNSPNTPIRDIADQHLCSLSPPSTIKRITYTGLATAIMIFALFGLGTYRVFLPSPGEDTEVYGLFAAMILGSTFFWAAYVFMNVFSGYNPNDSRNKINKIKSVCGNMGFVMMCFAGFVHLVQQQRDTVCRNTILQTVPSAEAGMNAFVIERYCAARNPINDKSPDLGVSVYPLETLQVPNERINTAVLVNNYPTSRGENLFKRDWKDSFKIDTVYWEGDKLVIEYSVVHGKSSRYGMGLQRHPPVTTILKRHNV
jgi:hypothetical protein